MISPNDDGVELAVKLSEIAKAAPVGNDDVPNVPVCAYIFALKVPVSVPVLLAYILTAPMAIPVPVKDCPAAWLLPSGEPDRLRAVF